MLRTPRATPHSPLRAAVGYEDPDDWRVDAERDLFAVVAALGMTWNITAPYSISDAQQIFPDGRRARLVSFSGPLVSRVTETVLDSSGEGNAVAELVALADDEGLQLVDWFLWGLQTEQQARDKRLAVIPYALVLDGLSTGKGKTLAKWTRLISWVESHGHHIEVTATAMVRARNAWVKERNFGHDTGEAYIGHFRDLARVGLVLRLRGNRPPG